MGFKYERIVSPSNVAMLWVNVRLNVIIYHFWSPWAPKKNKRFWPVFWQVGGTLCDDVGFCWIDSLVALFISCETTWSPRMHHSNTSLSQIRHQGIPQGLGLLHPNIQAVYPSKNTNSLLQTLDQRIIAILQSYHACSICTVLWMPQILQRGRLHSKNKDVHGRTEAHASERLRK